MGSLGNTLLAACLLAAMLSCGQIGIEDFKLQQSGMGSAYKEDAARIDDRFLQDTAALGAAGWEPSTQSFTEKAVKALAPGMQKTLNGLNNGQDKNGYPNLGEAFEWAASSQMVADARRKGYSTVAYNIQGGTVKNGRFKPSQEGEVDGMAFGPLEEGGEFTDPHVYSFKLDGKKFKRKTDLKNIEEVLKHARKEGGVVRYRDGAGEIQKVKGADFLKMLGQKEEGLKPHWAEDPQISLITTSDTIKKAPARYKIDAGITRKDLLLAVRRISSDKFPNVGEEFFARTSAAKTILSQAEVGDVQVGEHVDRVSIRSIDTAMDSLREIGLAKVEVQAVTVNEVLEVDSQIARIYSFKPMSSGLRNRKEALYHHLDRLGVDAAPASSQEIRSAFVDASEHHESLASLMEKGGKFRRAFRYGNRAFLILGAAYDTYRIITADNKALELARAGGGWGGALAAGSAASAALSWIDIAGPAGWAVDGVVGLAAGALGYWGGSKAGEAIYDINHPTADSLDPLPEVLDKLSGIEEL